MRWVTLLLLVALGAAAGLVFLATRTTDVATPPRVATVETAPPPPAEPVRPAAAPAPVQPPADPPIPEHAAFIASVRAPDGSPAVLASVAVYPADAVDHGSWSMGGRYY